MGKMSKVTYICGKRPVEEALILGTYAYTQTDRQTDR